MQERYDPEKEVYRYCRWCGGKGCLYCASEADKAYKAEFPDGPKPIAVFDISTPEGLEKARAVIGAEAITKAFASGGGGLAEILKSMAKAGVLGNG